jgi:hypothetical protein
MTKNRILQDLNEILAIWKRHPKTLLHEALEELRDELDRDIILFPEENT